ncbi:MAG: FAD-dependent oxidoreductase [Myxococcaceae bacterium]|nr:FAD-dependent oxidoreductase [Myxococcaceae bacterium]
MTQFVDVAVVGGGLTGLTAAALAARRGLSCVVLERSAEAGGRARSQHEAGAVLNLGPHALYLEGPAHRVLRSLGLPLKGRSPQSSGLAWNAGTLHHLPAGPVTLAVTCLLTAREKLETAKWLTRIQRFDASALAHVSLAQWLDGLALQPGTRALVELLVRVSSYAHAPHLISAQAALTQMQRGLKPGVRYLDGGWQTLVDGVRRAALESGAKLRVGWRAQSIRESEHGVWRVCSHHGEVVEAGQVIIASSPGEAVNLLEGAARHELETATADRVAVQAACLNLALTKGTRWRSTLALGLDEPLYLSLHSASAHLSDGAVDVVHVAQYLAPGESGAGARQRFDALLDAVAQGWRSRVVAERFMPNLTVAHALPLASRGGLAGRPGPALKSARGLFIAGDWVGSDGLLLDGCLASAAAAVELLVKGTHISYEKVA